MDDYKGIERYKKFMLERGATLEDIQLYIDMLIRRGNQSEDESEQIENEILSNMHDEEYEDHVNSDEGDILINLFNEEIEEGNNEDE